MSLERIGPLPRWYFDNLQSRRYDQLTPSTQLALEERVKLLDTPALSNKGHWKPAHLARERQSLFIPTMEVDRRTYIIHEPDNGYFGICLEEFIEEGEFPEHTVSYKWLHGSQPTRDYMWFFKETTESPSPDIFIPTVGKDFVSWMTEQEMSIVLDTMAADKIVYDKQSSAAAATLIQFPVDRARARPPVQSNSYPDNVVDFPA